MEGSPGGTALMLVTKLLAQLRTRGLADLDKLEQGLTMLLERPLTTEQLADAGNALAVVQGLLKIPEA
ncbi:MAG: hypothetical protein ACM3YM_09420 [Sphingomonadales bacterium]